MLVPGGNLLNAALTLIASQTVIYYRNSGASALSPDGTLIAPFDGPVTIESGSVQSVDLARYEQLGLDRKRSYRLWYVSQNVIGVGRNRAGDQFAYDNRRYDVIGETPWFTQDGWVGLIGVDIGSDSHA